MFDPQSILTQVYRNELHKDWFVVQAKDETRETIIMLHSQSAKIAEYVRIGGDIHALIFIGYTPSFVLPVNDEESRILSGEKHAGRTYASFSWKHHT